MNTSNVDTPPWVTQSTRDTTRTGTNTGSTIDPAIVAGLALQLGRGRGYPRLPKPIASCLATLADEGNATCRLVQTWLAGRDLGQTSNTSATLESLYALALPLAAEPGEQERRPMPIRNLVSVGAIAGKGEGA